MPRTSLRDLAKGGSLCTYLGCIHFGVVFLLLFRRTRVSARAQANLTDSDIEGIYMRTVSLYRPVRREC